MVKKREILRGILISVLFISLFPFKGDGTEKKEQKLTYVTLGNPTTPLSMYALPFNFGIKKGFYKREGIDLEFITMKTTSLLPGVVSGNLDYAGVASSTIYAAAAGMPIRCIFVSVETQARSIMSKPTLKEIKDLKGKKIGVAQIGSTEVFIVKEVAKFFGLNPDTDFTIMGTGAGMPIPALYSGIVDAILQGPPENILLRKKGYRELARVDNIVKTVGFGLGASIKKIKDNPQEVKKVIKGTLRSLIHIRSHKADVVDFMVKDMGLQKDVVEETYDVVTPNFTKDGSITTDLTQRTIDQGRILGFKMKEKVDPGEVVDFTLLKEVQKEIGILS